MTVEVRVVERDGTLIATFDADEGDGDTREKATVTGHARILNQPGSARVTVPVFHPAAASIDWLKVELQILRDGQIVPGGWLVPVQGRLNGAAWEITCAGVLWYLDRLRFGPITRNYLSNPRFESDLSGWSAVGTTATHSTALRIRGPGTARLEQASPDTDTYLAQGFTVTTGPAGLALFVAGWIWVDPSVPFAPAFDDRGIAVVCAGSHQGFVWEPVNNNIGIGQMVKVETVINVLPDLTDEPVEVRLYSPQGVVHWGAVVATEMESVASELDGTDVTEMMRRIVAYAQDPSRGKVDLDIAVPAQTPSGVTEVTAYQFMDLGRILPALQTYPARGLADFDVEVTETTKTFRTYAPSKGSDLSSTVIFTVPGSDVIRFGHITDATITATGVVRRFAGSGPTRELGVAVDTTDLDVLLQDVDDVGPEVPLDALDQVAATDLARTQEVVTIPDFVVPASEIFGTVDVGDMVGVSVDWGALQETVPRRVFRLVWDPVADTVAVGVTQ